MKFGHSLALTQRRRGGLAQLTKFHSSLKNTLIPERGTAWIFGRTTTATVVDHEGVVRTCKIGEARFAEMRRVENTIPTDVSAWTGSGSTVTPGVLDPDGGSTAYTVSATTINALQYRGTGYAAGASVLNSVWVRRRSGTGAVWLFTGAASWGKLDISASLTTAWKRIPTPVNTVGTDSYFGVQISVSGDQVDVWHGQCENVTGQSVQTPAEYQFVGTGGPLYGVDVITNGNFSNAVAGWNAQAGWSITTGRASFNGGNATITQQTGTQNMVYLLTWTIESISSGIFYPYTGSPNSGLQKNAPGTYTAVVTCSGDNWLGIAAGPGTVGVVTNVSYKPCLYNGANVDGVGYYSTRLDGTPIYEVSGPELVSNGSAGFTDTTGWSASGTGVMSVVGGKLRLTSTSGICRAQIVIANVPGRSYKLMSNVNISGNGSFWVRHGNGGSGDYLFNNLSTQANNVVITADNSTANFMIAMEADLSGYAELSLVSMRELKPLEGLGIEQIVNGNFAAGAANWNTQAGWSIATGAASAVAASTSLYGQTLTAGVYYKGFVTVTVASGSVTPYIGIGDPLTPITVSGTYPIAGFCMTNGTFYMLGASFTGAVTNVSLRPVTQGAGALSEPARTNQQIQSQNFAAANWGVVNMTVASTTALAPDGSLAACTVADNATSGIHTFQNTSAQSTLTANVVYTKSCFLSKSNTLRYVQLPIVGNANSYAMAIFDSLTGAVTQTGSGNGGTFVAAKATPVGSYGWRIEVTGSVNVTSVDWCSIAGASAATGNTLAAAGNPTYVGTGQSFTFWGYQIEVGASASTYIPTTTTAVTRAADSGTAPVSASVTQGTLCFTLVASGPDTAFTYPGVCVRANDVNNCIGVFINPAMAGLSLVSRSNGVAGAMPQLVASPVAGVAYKIAISWNNGRIAYCVNNGTVGVLTGQTMPVALSTLAMALDSTWIGNVTNERLLSFAVSDATLPALTA